MHQAPPDQNHWGNGSPGTWCELLSWEAVTSSPVEASSGVSQFSLFTEVFVCPFFQSWSCLLSPAFCYLVFYCAEIATILTESRRGFLGGQRSQRRHGHSGCPAPGFRPGLIWGLWSPRGHAATQLEGEHGCGLQHHHDHRAAGRAVDGLHVVQHRDVQLHSEVLRPGPPQPRAGREGRHDPGLHPVCSGDLHFHSGDGVHSLRRGPGNQEACLFCWRSLFSVCRDLWFNTNCVVHKGDHSKLSGLHGSTKQQTWAWRSCLPWNHFGRAAGDLWHDLLHILSEEEFGSFAPPMQAAACLQRTARGQFGIQHEGLCVKNCVMHMEFLGACCDFCL